jgi:hypothetical protein
MFALSPIDALPPVPLSSVAALHVSFMGVGVSFRGELHPARGFVVGYKTPDHTLAADVVLWFPDLFALQVYPWAGLPLTPDTLPQAVSAGVDFLESMGYLLEPLDLGDPHAMNAHKAWLRNLPFLTDVDTDSIEVEMVEFTPSAIDGVPDLMLTPAPIHRDAVTAIPAVAEITAVSAPPADELLSREPSGRYGPLIERSLPRAPAPLPPNALRAGSGSNRAPADPLVELLAQY